MVNSALRVMTYNVYGFRKLKKFSIEDYVERIRSLDADVLLLQEVDDGRAQKFFRNPVEKLAEQMGMNFIYHPTLKFSLKDSSFGNAILSRYPLVEKKSDLLPGRSWKTIVEPRGAIWAEIDLGLKKVNIFNTHISFFKRQQENQVKSLVSDWISLTKHAEEAVILGGDFNLGYRSKCFRHLNPCLESCNEDVCMPTWPSKKPWRQLDYLFYNALCKKDRCFVADRVSFKELSDHLPFVADFRIM